MEEVVVEMSLVGVFQNPHRPELLDQVVVEVD
jgi:hypothetical protein